MGRAGCVVLKPNQCSECHRPTAAITLRLQVQIQVNSYCHSVKVPQGVQFLETGMHEFSSNFCRVFAIGMALITWCAEPRILKEQVK